MIARQEGIGNLLFTSMDMAQYSTVYAVIMLLAVLGIACDALFEFVRKRCTHWHDSTQSLMDKG
jgi:NitT/TauT family transport system permease protein